MADADAYLVNPPEHRGPVCERCGKIFRYESDLVDGLCSECEKEKGVCVECFEIFQQEDLEHGLCRKCGGFRRS